MTTKAAGDKKKPSAVTNNNQSLQDLEKILWKAADKLRSNMDAAEYKHVVLNLILLKYISDSFEQHRTQLKGWITTPPSHKIEENSPETEYYQEGLTGKELKQELEVRDYYTSYNVFWVPKKARWGEIQGKAKQPDIGKIIDAALDALEKDNPRLKGIFSKDFARRQSHIRLGELVDLISTIGFNNDQYGSKDVLGHVYEYFLGQFASAEGKKGGQFYTPASIVNLIVECLEPYQGRVYDPAMGSGGFFVSSKNFIKAHSDKRHAHEAQQNISLYGQESNPTTWKLAAMNMVIRRLDFKFGKGPADTFHDNQHPSLKADFIMANPPFNLKDWGGEQLVEDQRWKYGIPATGNANFAWLQHIIHHLAPKGYAGIVLANGSLSSKTNNEGEIRKNLIEADLVDCIIALPGQLFFNTQISACIWIFAKDKTGKTGKRKRTNEVLFLDASNFGQMINRKQKELSEDDIKDLSDIYHNWRNKKGKYQDKLGLCKSAAIAEIKSHEYMLTPGHYVGIAEEEDDFDFKERFESLLSDLKKQLKEETLLNKRILNNLGKIDIK